MPFYRITIEQDAYIPHEGVIEAENAEIAAELAKQAWSHGRPAIKLTEGEAYGFDHADCDPDNCMEISEEEYRTGIAPAHGWSVSAPKTFKVTGSYGELTVDATTGNVLNYEPGLDYQDGDPGYHDIVCFDVDEFTSYWNEEPENVDIIGIGFWTNAGVYAAPEEDWRQEIKRARAER